MSIKDRGNIIAKQIGGAGVLSEGVSFDGTTDYLSRDTDLVDNTDSKTFTFSCWVYGVPYDNGLVYQITDGDNFCQISYYGDTQILHMLFSNSAGDYVFKIFIKNTAPYVWNNIIVSCDMDNGYSTYLNDIVPEVEESTFTTGETIDFTMDYHTVGSKHDNSYPLKGRLAHFFLDYTYRDLSIEDNRRLFITADGKPATGLENLDSILYLPMKDAATAHLNLGTGGDFVQNGLIETADRGANQDNCVMSSFDGVDDYLQLDTLSNSDASNFTLSFIADIDDSRTILCKGDYELKLYFAGTTLLMYGKNIDGDTIYDIGWSTTVNGVHTFTISFRFIDGNDFTCVLSIDGANPYSYNKVWTDIQEAPTLTDVQFRIGAANDDDSLDIRTGSLGEIYFDTNYINLATSNPFWNSETNKPIPVRKAMETLGSNPLICMPIDASNPTKNYGSGGDFTLNGGGLLGARGMSEYIARSILTDSSNYLKGNVNCNSLVKCVSTDNGVTWDIIYSNNETVTVIDSNIRAYYFGFSTTIDWNLEENRNKIINQLGYPRDPEKVLIDSGWTAVLGLFFDNIFNLGENKYGNDFSIIGTPITSKDFKL